eukprot:gene23152-30003_t
MKTFDRYSLEIKPSHFRSTFPKSSVHTSLPELKIREYPSKLHKTKKVVQNDIIVDAETGENLSLTVARWNCREGRVNMDSKSIIATGTGKLDVSSRAMNNAQFLSTISSPISDNTLVRKYIENGPLNIMYHVNWDSKTNTLLMDTPEGVKTVAEMTSPSNKDKELILALASVDISSADLDDPLENLSFDTNVNTFSSETATLRDQKAWKQMQSKIFNDLFTMAFQLERNKFLTHEKRTKGGLEEVRENCKLLAKLKVRHLRDLVHAIDDESLKEKKREEAELACAGKAKKLSLIRKAHDAEREKARNYIETMQNDAEVIFIRKLSELEYLW